MLYQRDGDRSSDAVLIDMRAVGDVMLSRYVAQVSHYHGYTYPFALVGATGQTPLLNGDLVVGNLESPLSPQWQALVGDYSLPAPPAFAEPSAHAPAPLAAAGFDILSLANNHALDAGPASLHYTVERLQENNIAPVGAGPDRVSARSAYITTTQNLRIAFLAFNDIGNPEDAVWQWRGETDWSRAWLDYATFNAIRRVRRMADVVVVMVHWGEEYSPTPSLHQQAWARGLVDAGADVVLGTHPHVLQPVQTMPGTIQGRTSVVAYSLGNFLFDQYFSRATSTSVVMRVLLDKRGVAGVAVAPIEIVNGQVRPLPLDNDEHDDIIAALTPQDQQLQQAHISILCSAPLTTAQRIEPYMLPAPMAIANTCRSDNNNDNIPASINTAIAQCRNAPAQCIQPPRNRLPADLRGNGEPLWVTLDEYGVVRVYDGARYDAPMVWQNEAFDWHVRRIAVGDPNHDGRIEVALLLWKPDADTGLLRSHVFLVGWRGGYYRIIWGSSATRMPIYDMAIGDVNGDGEEELVILEESTYPDETSAIDNADKPVRFVSVWSWHSWEFQHEWRSSLGTWQHLTVQDVTGDGADEVVVWE